MCIFVASLMNGSHIPTAVMFFINFIISVH